MIDQAELSAFAATYKATATGRTVKTIGAFFAADIDAAKRYAARVVARETDGGVLLSVYPTADPRTPEPTDIIPPITADLTTL